MTDTQQASDEEIAALKVRGRYGHGERMTVDGAPVGPADTPEPLFTGFERVYAEIHGEPVAWHILNEERQVICWHQHKASAEKDVATYYAHRKVTVEPLYAHPDPAVERLQRELDEARGIVRDIHWMACRYADGRNTYAPGMYNRAIAKAYDAGWLTFDHTGRRYDVQYARDGMLPEWKTVEERATSAEASLAKAREALRQIAEHKERDEGVNGDNCRWSYSIGWAFHNCQSIARAALKERTDG